MDRAQQIENIIIGSVLNDYDEYWPSVRFCITADMLSDDMNKALFQKMREGKTDIVTLTSGMPTDDLLKVFDLAAYNDFRTKKCLYNEDQFLFSDSPKYTRVSFEDYINQFVKTYFNGKK